jgi:hypothetical protein
MTITGKFKPTVTVLTFVAALSFPLIGNAQNNAPLSDNQQLFEDDVIPQSRITPERDSPAADRRVAPVPDEAFADREPNWGSEDDRSRPSRPTRPSDRNTQSPLRAREVRRTVVQTVYEPIPAEELAAAKKIQEAIKLLKSAKGDEVRKSATATIQEQLNSQFDRDVEQRERELVEVEQRVKTLREQLDKRKSLRDDIIGLRLKTIQNDAEGLGFPGRESLGRSVFDSDVSSPDGGTFDSDGRPLLGMELFDPRARDAGTFQRNDGKTPFPVVDEGRDIRDVVETGTFFESSTAGNERDAQLRFTAFLRSQRDGALAFVAFDEIRGRLAKTRDVQPIVEWARDRSKENRKLEGFALLRWDYGPEIWTEKLEAVRKLDPALANETDALLAPFLKPEAEASQDNQKQKVGDDLFDESPKRKTRSENGHRAVADFREGEAPAEPPGMVILNGSSGSAGALPSRNISPARSSRSSVGNFSTQKITKDMNSGRSR